MLFGKNKKFLFPIIVAIVLIVTGYLPAGIKADVGPVDLTLGGEGATSWNVSNIKPGDNDTKAVTLHNAGTADGFITIWLSELVTIKGPNIEAKASANTTRGFADQLLIGLNASGLSSSVELPIAINKLPLSSQGPGYIEVTPLKAGKTINLEWKWELPTSTGNEVQGDSVGFTINYLLEECRITDVSNVVTTNGTFTENITAESTGGKGTVDIQKDTVGQTKDGKPLSEIWLIEEDKKLPPPPTGTATIGLVSYNAGPDGATFDRPITLTVSYDPNNIPQGVNEADLVIALWDKNAGAWVPLEGCTVDKVNRTILAPVTHFSRYSIIAPVPPPPPPPVVVETPSEPGEDVVVTPSPVTLQVIIEGKASGIKVATDGTVQEAATLADATGNFVISINKGTKVTGPDGMGLERLELTLVEEPIAKGLLAVPANTVILSPVYKMTGYSRGMEVSRINFDPYIAITISYNPENLENIFPPYIVNFTEYGSLVRLELPSGSLFENGKAKGVAHQASYFAVIAELAPPPPPLPPKFEASSLIISPRLAKPGQPISISVTIANQGTISGSYEMHLVIDGIVRAVKEITLNPESTTTVAFEVSNLAAGKHQIKIAGLAGQFQVISPVISPLVSHIDWEFIDLSIMAIIVAGLLVSYLFIRRSQRLHRVTQ